MDRRWTWPVAAGAALPLLLWAAIAATSGSPLMPRKTHLNLAMTYFGEGNRLDFTSMRSVEDRFDSTLDVLRHDPPAMASRYVTDLGRNLQKTFWRNSLVERPLNFLAIPGIFILGLFRPSRRKTLFLLIAAAQLLLLNFKTYEPRHHLSFVPWLGAAAAWSVTGAARLAGTRLVLIVLVPLVATAPLRHLPRRWSTQYRWLHENRRELETAAAAMRRVGAGGETLATRKPHLSFYTGGTFRFVPHPSGEDELRSTLAACTGEGSLFYFFGEPEYGQQPNMRYLLDPSRAPPWLELAARGDEQTPWTLYRVRLE